VGGRRTDANQKDIVADLRSIGADVVPTHAVGIEGFPDLVVGFRQMNFLLEVKTEKGQIRPEQAAFQQSWRGQVAIARSIDEAIDILNSATLRLSTSPDQQLFAKAIATVREGGGYGTVTIELNAGDVRRMSTTISEHINRGG